MIARTTKALLGNKNILRFGFCLNKAHLDPYKHTTMNHYPHNMYVDLYDFGEYPEVVMPASIAPRTYQPIVVATIVDVLNLRYGTSLTVESFNEKLDRPWSRFIQKDLNSKDEIKVVLSPIVNRLAINIFVRQSRWTWIKEQKQRLDATSIYFEKYKPKTPREFLEIYNALIEKLVLASTFGMSPHIPQSPSPLEKHYVQEMADSVHEGVEELNNLKGEHNNAINRFLGLLHRL